MESDKPIEITLHLFPKLEKVGHFITGLFQQLHYEGHSDHHFEHPLDTPVQPVSDLNWPNRNRWDDCGRYLEAEE